MAALRKLFKGLHTYRFGDNPLERKFARAWQKQHDVHNGTLQYLLGDGAVPVDPSDRDFKVAATVIQWLGSPVGQGFLRDVGFVPVEEVETMHRRGSALLKPKKRKK